MSNWCEWFVAGGPMWRDYHDKEWGVPVHDDRKLFEYLLMENMSCGLSWSLMLKKREVFRQVFDGFDFRKVAMWTEVDIDKKTATEGMIHSRRKIAGIVNNARRIFSTITDNPAQSIRNTRGIFIDYKILLHGFVVAVGRLVGEGVAGFLAEVPVQGRTEAEVKDTGEPDEAECVVIPDELGRVVEVQEVVAGNGNQAEDGRYGAGIVEGFLLYIEYNQMPHQLRDGEKHGSHDEETHLRQEYRQDVDEQERKPVPVHGIEVVAVPFGGVGFCAVHHYFHSQEWKSPRPAELFEEMQAQDCCR